MGKETKADFNFEQAALLRIKPIEPAKTFQLTREIRWWEAEQILAMHPRRSHRLGMPRIKLEMPRVTWGSLRDFAEISVHTLSLAFPTALGVSLILTPPVIFLELCSSFLSGRSPQLAETTITWGGLTATLAGLGGLYGGWYEAIHQPDARFFRFGKSR